VRTVTVESVSSKITYTLAISNDAATAIPTFVLELDGNVNDNALDVSPDLISMDLVVNARVVPPVKSKTPTKSSKPTAKPTSKPSVSAAFGAEFSPLTAFVSLVAAAVCRGLTQNNKMSFGLFIVVALIFASVESDAAKTFEAKNVDLTLLLPPGWTSSEILPFTKKITKDFDFTVAPPSPTPSNSASRSIAATQSAAASRSVTPSVTH